MLPESYLLQQNARSRFAANFQVRIVLLGIIGRLQVAFIYMMDASGRSLREKQRRSMRRMQGHLVMLRATGCDVLRSF